MRSAVAGALEAGDVRIAPDGSADRRPEVRRRSRRRPVTDPIPIDENGGTAMTHGARVHRRTTRRIIIAASAGQLRRVVRLGRLRRRRHDHRREVLPREQSRRSAAEHLRRVRARLSRAPGRRHLVRLDRRQVRPATRAVDLDPVHLLRNRAMGVLPTYAQIGIWRRSCCWCAGSRSRWARVASTRAPSASSSSTARPRSAPATSAR